MLRLGLRCVFPFLVRVDFLPLCESLERDAPVVVVPAGETIWELWHRIEPVAIVYGGGRRLHVTEHNSAPRLMRELWRLGRRRVRIRGVISEKGSLSRLSVCALNLYLRHYYSVQSLNALRVAGVHRLAWYDLQREIAVSWVR